MEERKIKTQTPSFVNTFEELKQKLLDLPLESLSTLDLSALRIGKPVQQGEQALVTLQGHSGVVWCLTDLGDGRLASGSDDKTIKLWHVGPRGLSQSEQVELKALIKKQQSNSKGLVSKQKAFVTFIEPSKKSSAAEKDRDKWITTDIKQLKQGLNSTQDITGVCIVHVKGGFSQQELTGLKQRGVIIDKSGWHSCLESTLKGENNKQNRRVLKRLKVGAQCLLANRQQDREEHGPLFQAWLLSRFDRLQIMKLPLRLGLRVCGHWVEALESKVLFKEYSDIKALFELDEKDVYGQKRVKRFIRDIEEDVNEHSKAKALHLSASKFFFSSYFNGDFSDEENKAVADLLSPITNQYTKQLNDATEIYRAGIERIEAALYHASFNVPEDNFKRMKVEESLQTGFLIEE